MSVDVRREKACTIFFLNIRTQSLAANTYN